MFPTAKDGCPQCGAKFRTGALPSIDERRQLLKMGVIDLGEPPEKMPCPKCGTPLKVVSLRMGTFFTLE